MGYGFAAKCSNYRYMSRHDMYMTYMIMTY